MMPVQPPECSETRAALRWDGGLALRTVPGRGRSAEREAATDAARAALVDAGSRDPGDVERAADGRPLWPQGWTGSITHADGTALAVACRTAARAAVGVDLEVNGALASEDAWPVLSASEREILRSGVDPTWLWSAKEAAFKAWSHGTGGLLGPVDPTEIVVELRTGGDVDITPVGSLGRRVGGLSLEGRWGRVAHFVVVLCSLPARYGVQGIDEAACHHRGTPEHPG
jgi:hypothetical protein